MREVVAGLIIDCERFFVARRPLYKARGGLWEFIGGKVEEGETHENALKREFSEETGAEIEVGELCFKTFHSYPDIDITLYLYKAKYLTAPKLLEHIEFAWVRFDEIDNYDFCPADHEILEILKTGKGSDLK